MAELPQGFNDVAEATDEDEHVAVERIAMQRHLYLGRQAVVAAAHVGGA